MKKQYTPELKAKITLEALREEKMLSEIASEYEIHPTMLSKWKSEAIAGLPMVFRRGQGLLEKQKEEYEAKIEELYKQIGRLSTDLEWLKKKSGM